MSNIKEGRYPYRFDDRLGGWLFAWFCVAAISLLLAGWATDSRGAKEWNHREGVPHGVIQLAANSYLFTTDARVGPAQVCRGTESSQSAKPVETAREIDNAEIPGIDEAIFVVCDRDQTWDDHRAGSPNFGRALLRVMVAPLWLVPSALSIILIGLVAGFIAVRVNINRTKIARRRAAANEVKRKREYRELEARYRAIQMAYAKDEIDDLTFDNKVKELVESGYELPDRDIFK